MDESKYQTQVVVLDTCILISNVLRFLSLGLAKAGYFQPAWSPQIREEWLRNASRLWEVERSELEQDWALWEQWFPLADQGIVHNYQEGLRYSDPKDWHVIAAARAAQHSFPGGCVGILTKNTKDFNRSELKRLDIARWAPDAFFCELWPRAQAVFMPLLQQMPDAVRAPDKEPLSTEALLKRERLFELAKRYTAVNNGMVPLDLG